MASYNKVILIGRLTAEPELKTTQNGVSVLSGSVAVDRHYKQGEEKKTDFINFVAWRTTAEFIKNYFHKGNAILLEGELQTRQYTAQDGTKRTVAEVIVSQAGFIESKAQGNGNAPTAQTEQAAQAQHGNVQRYGEANDTQGVMVPVNEASFTTIPDEDDLPF